MGKYLDIGVRKLPTFHQKNYMIEKNDCFLQIYKYINIKTTE